VGEFGDKFRKARENKNLTLDQVSNVTKIGARMLQAIEEEKFDQLPGGVFNKGFIRAYARHLGINDEEAVTEYLACLRQAQIAAHAVWEPPTRVMMEVKRPPVAAVTQTVKVPSPAHLDDLEAMHLPRAEDVRPPREKFVDKRDLAPNWRLLAVAVLVLLLLVVLWRRHSAVDAQVTQPEPVTASAQPNPPSANPSSTNQPSTSAVSPASTPINPPVRGSSLGSASSQVSAPQNGASASKSVQSSASNGAANATQDKAQLTLPKVANTPVNAAIDNSAADNDVTTRSFGAASTAAAGKTAAPLTLVIRATENSWISVSADGKTASHETLIAPAATSVRANREIVAKVGNAAGVIFLWKGQEIQAQGAESETKTFVFDANGMRVVGAGQNP
jgi:cytoskeletal protein RodZ